MRNSQLLAIMAAILYTKWNGKEQDAKDAVEKAKLILEKI